MPVTKQNVDKAFTYHAPTPAQVVGLLAVREAGKALAEAILEHVPQCADQQAALRHVREAVMTANAAIALEGLI